MISLSSKFLKIIAITVILVSFCSCATGPNGQKSYRDVASKDCNSNPRAEYHSYFDSYEKCIENKEVK